jgi:hypothetical protein
MSALTIAVIEMIARQKFVEDREARLYGQMTRWQQEAWDAEDRANRKLVYLGGVGTPMLVKDDDGKES